MEEMKGAIKMKKKRILTALLMAAAAGAVLAGCGNSRDIGRDKALEAALGDAAVSESDTTRLKVSEDREDGRKIYEIKFDAGNREYEYEILASDGSVISSDVETVNDSSTAGENETQDSSTAQKDKEISNAADTQNQTFSKNSSASGTAVSKEDAVRIALERVPGATEKNVKIELERDDGRYKYEGEIIYDNIEYDFEIDADSGTILEWSEERF